MTDQVGVSRSSHFAQNYGGHIASSPTLEHPLPLNYQPPPPSRKSDHTDRETTLHDPLGMQHSMPPLNLR
jgi:hypothetical protein